MATKSKNKCHSYFQFRKYSLTCVGKRTKTLLVPICGNLACYSQVICKSKISLITCCQFAVSFYTEVIGLCFPAISSVPFARRRSRGQQICVALPPIPLPQLPTAYNTLPPFDLGGRTQPLLSSGYRCAASPPSTQTPPNVSLYFQRLNIPSI